MWGQLQFGVKTGLNVPLPTEILAQVLDTAFLAYGSRVWVGSGLLLTFGFLWRIVREKWAVVCGEKEWPDYWTPIMLLVGTVALLGSYQACVRGCIQVVGNLAQGFISHDELGQALFARAQALAAVLPEAQHNLPMLSINTLLVGLFYTVSPFLFGFVAWAVWSLKCLQTFVLAVIIIYGPIALSFSFIGGIFSGLGLAWFWALIEISAWGVTFDVLNFVLTPVIEAKPDEFLLINELGLCLVLLVLVRAVPQVTSMLVRGTSHSIQQIASPAAYAGAMFRAGDRLRRFVKS